MHLGARMAARPSLVKAAYCTAVFGGIRREEGDLIMCAHDLSWCTQRYVCFYICSSRSLRTLGPELVQIIAQRRESF